MNSRWVQGRKSWGPGELVDLARLGLVALPWTRDDLQGAGEPPPGTEPWILKAASAMSNAPLTRDFLIKVQTYSPEGA